MSQVDPNHSDQLLEAIKSELHNCHAQYNQAHLFLTEIFNRLHSTQELIGQYQTSAKSKDERIVQLEAELKLKSQQVEAVSFEHEELRRRIKSEKHNALQYKAALHRCLDTSQREELGQAHTQVRNLTHSLADSVDICSYDRDSINLAPSQIDSPQFDRDLAIQDQIDRQAPSLQASVSIELTSDKNEALKDEAFYGTDRIADKIPEAKLESRLETKGESKAEIHKDHKTKPHPVHASNLPEEKSKSFAAIKLPQFAPLKPR